MRSHRRRLTLPFTAFVAFHLVVNLRFYGPLNYLWLCDLALLTAAVGFWTGRRVLLGMAAVGVLGPSVLWTLDLGWRVVMGHYLVHVAAYMADRNIPLPTRLASTFHLWLPVVLIWELRRVGYDRRSLLYQTLFAILVLIGCRLLTQPPPARDERDETNVNWVYGPDDDKPQTALPSAVCIGWIIARYFALMYLPSHLVIGLLTTGRLRNPQRKTTTADYQRRAYGRLPRQLQ